MSGPIPLSQVGGDNTMMYVGILACCCLVSSSGAGALIMSRKKTKKKSRRRRGRGRGRRRKRGRGRRRRRRCFSPETLIKLQNGETRAMKNLELGDILVNGSIVKATMQIKNESDTYYKLPGDILVTGSHYIKDGDTYKQVKNFSKAEATSQLDPIVSCLITNDHKIPVGDFIFWDWEDNLVQQ
jgi:hypothetical protein